MTTSGSGNNHGPRAYTGRVRGLRQGGKKLGANRLKAAVASLSSRKTNDKKRVRTMENK